MAPALLNAVLERVHKIVRPKSYLLVYFNSEDRARITPVYSFRIQDKSTLMLVQRGTRAAAQSFNNRGLEKLFAKFEIREVFPDEGSVAGSDCPAVRSRCPLTPINSH